jgi:hypothetical protein
MEISGYFQAFKRLKRGLEIYKYVCEQLVSAEQEL